MKTLLYERLGGADGIARLVDDVVEAHLNNPIIKARFLPYLRRPEVVGRVKQHMVICSVPAPVARSNIPEETCGRRTRA